MTPSQNTLRRKALLAAGSVVLALQGCDDWEVLIQQHDCDEEDAATYAATDTGWVDDPALEPDCTQAAEPWTCCDDRATWCEENRPLLQSFDTCYYGPGFDGSTGCIPWGPPAPPRLGALLG